MLVKYVCLECGFCGEVESNNRKLKCPICKTINDWWIKGETPPPNHR
jgi:phage FluMu protein Com